MYEILECVEIIWIKIEAEVKYRSVCKIIVVLLFCYWVMLSRWFVG
jgi:hypothetical protein